MGSLDLWKQKLDELGTKVGQASDLVAQYNSASYQIPDLAKKRVTEMYNGNQDLINEEAQAQADLNTTATDYAARMKGGSFAGDPILAGQAAAQREASIQKRLTAIRGMRTAREGTMAELVDSTTRAFGAQTAAVEGEAQRIKDEYGMASDSYSREYQAEQDRLDRERQERQDAEQRRQFEITESRLRASQGDTIQEAIDKEAKNYSYDYQKDNRGNVVGFSFYGKNKQPVSITTYFAGINGGTLNFTQMADLLKTAESPNAKKVAAEIYNSQSQGIAPETLAESLRKKYPHMFD